MADSHPFLQFLVATDTEDEATHVSYINKPGIWKVEDADLEDFWISYCRSSLKFLRKDRSANLSLAELPVKYPPVIVDMTFRCYIGNCGIFGRER